MFFMSLGAGLAADKAEREATCRKIIENDDFRAKTMFFLDFSISAASGMLLSPPGAPQSYSREFFDKHNVFRELGCRVSGRQGWAGGKLQAKS